MSGQFTRIAVLADDLTGALDCAAAFLSSGYSPFVSIDGRLPPAADSDVVALNMDTRRMSRVSAAAVVRSSVEKAMDPAPGLLYVKIDSTLRGHPGVELCEAAKTVGASVVVMCPAFPATGRTVIDGTLLIHGTPLAETEVGRDPLSPASASRVSASINADCGAKVVEVSLAALRGGKLSEMLKRAPTHGMSVFCCDAESDGDLDLIAAASGDMPQAVFAGSAGLAEALARATAMRHVSSPVVEATTGSGPIMVVTASQRSLADQQIDAAAAGHRLATVRVTFVIDDTGGIETVEFDASSASEMLAEGRHAALRARISGDLSHLSPIAMRSLADAVTTRLGEIAAGICAATRPSALVLIGGDTAFGALSALGAHGIVLRSQPLPGVPVGAIAGGMLDGTVVATKAGAFGDDRTLVRLFDHLLNGRAER